MDINLAINFLDRTKPFLLPNDHAKAIQQHHLFLLDTNSPTMKNLQEFHTKVKQGIYVNLSLNTLPRNELLCQNFGGLIGSNELHIR